MTLLFTIAVLLVLALAVFAYVPRPAKAISGSGINVPSQWHVGSIDRFRVGTYNIHRGRGTDGQTDLHRTAEVMRGVHILGLQEVEGSGWGTSQVQVLGDSLDMGWLYLPTRYRWLHDDRGNGLLSVFPVNHWYCERLPYSERRTPRILASARVSLRDTELWVLVTHLNTQEGRTEQLKVVLDRFSHYSPAILLGDLNTDRDDPLLVRHLGQDDNTDALRVALGDRDPRQRIDWILTRGLEVEAGGMDDNSASDHPFYWVDVKISV